MRPLDERVRAPWSPLEAVPIALVAVAAAVVAASAFVAMFGGVGGRVILLTGFVFQLALAAATIVWVAVRYRGSVAALGLRSRRGGQDVAIGGVLGALMFLMIRFGVAPAVVLAWQVLTGHPPDAPNQLPFQFGAVEIVIGTIVIVLAAPIGEEIFYRGFLFGSLRGRIGLWGAAVVSALLFGLSHAGDGLVLVPLLAVFGLGQAFLYERRGSLAAPMAAHGVFNVVGYTWILLDRL